MDRTLLAEADRIVSTLRPGHQEAIKEVVINAIHRRTLDDRARRFLDSCTGGPLVADVLAEALAEGDTRFLGVGIGSYRTREDRIADF